MILALDGDDGILKIGTQQKTLPGIVDSISISASLLVETPDQQGRSGKIKIVQGWDDAGLTITLLLIDDPENGITRWDFLRQITSVFYKVAKDGKPEIYTVSHPMISAWGSTRFLFSSLETSEDRNKRRVTISLEFVEYENSARVIQDRQIIAQPTRPTTAETPPVSDQQRRGLGVLGARFGN